MKWDSIHNELLDIFIQLIDDKISIERIMTKAGVPNDNVNFDSTSKNTWFLALKEAIKHERVLSIAEEVSKEYPNNKSLTSAISELKQRQRDLQFEELPAIQASNEPETLVPKIYINASWEAKSIVLELLDPLESQGFVTNPWDIDFLEAGKKSMKELLQAIKDTDYAIFIFTEEDIDEIQKSEKNATRDVVVFAMGLFMGILGKERVFFLRPAYKRAYILTEIEDFPYYKYDHKTKSLNEFSASLIQKIKKLGVRKPNQPVTIFKRPPAGFIEQLTHYSFQIFNKKGDAKVTRKIVFEVNDSPIGERFHVIYCNSTPTVFNDLQLKAWDFEENTLALEQSYDSPNKKEFKVIFKNLIKAGSEYGYSYEFFWDGMFPIDGTDFTLKANAKRILFDLIIPKTWELLYVRAYEKDNNGATSSKNLEIIEIEEEKFDSSFKRLAFELGDYSEELLEAYLEWKFLYK